MMQFLFSQKANGFLFKNKMWTIKSESNILSHISEIQGKASFSYSKTISVIKSWYNHKAENNNTVMPLLYMLSCILMYLS